MGFEAERVEKVSSFYIEDQLKIDRRLIGFRFETISPWLSGRDCLELGPGSGESTFSLVDIFESVTVVEGSKTLLANLPAHPKLEKIHSLFENFEPRKSFDFILADHVLEHVEDPRTILNRMKNWLAPGGKIVVGVPNANSLHRLAAVKMGLLSSQFELNERDHILGHRRVYSMEGLIQDLQNSGLTIIHTGGVFLKCLSNGQMEKNFSEEMIAGFYELGKDLPEIAAEIFAVCTVAPCEAKIT